MAEKTASLTVLGGAFAGTRCALPDSGTVTIGSAEGSTLRLDLPTVSPYHARIEVAAGRVTVHDTGAERALHVNDNPLEPGGTVLRNGDILWLGAPGEEDVVMLQCILPRRPVEAPAPAPEPPAPPGSPAAPPLPVATPGPATPTPEVETQALWASAGEAEAEPEAPDVVAEVVPARAPETVAEGVPEPAAEGAAERAPGRAPEEELVFAEPSLVGASDKEVGDAVQDAEEVVFADEVVDATEVEAAPSPTILTASAEELAEPQAVSIDFGEGVTTGPEPVAGPAPPPAPPEPMFAPVPAVEAEAVFAPEAAEEPPAPPAAPAPPAPKPPPLPPAHGPSPPAAAKPPGSAPSPPAPRPVAPQRPATPSPAPRPARPVPPAPAAPREGRPPAPPAAPPARRTAPRPAPRIAPARSAAAPPAEGPEVVEAAPAPLGSRKSMLLALAGAGGVLVLAGVVWVAWHSLAGRPSTPRPRPTPIVRATPPPAPLPAPTAAPAAVEPTPAAAAPTPVETPTPAATPRATPTPAATPRATPTPAAARPAPTPAGPSAEALMAQQKAQEAQSLLAQAETALGARQYDAAVSHLDGVLRLDPANARATTLRADAVRRRDLARRRFTPGKTVVQGGKAQKAGGLAGFDTEDADLRSSDFNGRVDFEMAPSSGIEPGDAWTLKIYVVNEGKKAIRVNGLVLGTTVNGTGSGGPLSPRVREVAPQQRSLVAETAGTWAEGTTSWTAEVTVTGGKGESLKNTLSWR
jgi:hypothetical protein